MGRFVEGEDRSQSLLLPESLDDYVGEDNPVRVIEAFIDALDLGELGFAGMVPAVTGRPAYHPSSMLKIYLYGYLNRIQSSRRLEREAGRNIELMWLTGRLMPDFKTIANFRRDNGPAIGAVCSQFVVLCRNLGLFTAAVVAIDGSKFKAVNNRDKNFTAHKVEARIEHVDANITRYLAALDRADREESDVPEVKVTRLKDKIAGLRRQMQDLKAMAKRVEASPDRQVSLTDPDSRSMATSGRGSGMVGYNVQVAVDTEHHLIVAHEIATTGSDRSLLKPMAAKAKDTMGGNKLTAIADRGYFSGEQILECDEAGIVPLVPKPLTSSGITRGLFSKQDFFYMLSMTTMSVLLGKSLPKVRIDQTGMVTSISIATSPPVSPARSNRAVRWRSCAVSGAGIMKPCSTPCRNGSITCPTPWRSADVPSNIPSAPSRPGWGRPIFSPRHSQKSKPR